MDARRKQLEEQVIRHYMGSSKSYQFCDLATSKPYLRMAARTNSNNVYVIRIELADYPNSKPNAYVETMLKDYKGHKMDGASGSNHTLTAHEKGYTQICHYHPEAWRPDMSLWMVYVRCVMWLNVYEKSLRDKKPLDYYLGHMDGDYQS